MKKLFFVLSTLAVAALALVSCNKEQAISIKIEPKGIPFEIVASSIQSKTVNDDMATLWEAGDQINLFHAVSGETTYVNDGAFEATADGASVSFTGTLGAALSDGNYNWYAVYPYAAAFDAPDGSATITIPAAQTQTGNDSKAHLSGANCPVAGNVKTVAHDATPTVAFKHLTTIIKVHVTNKTAAAVTVDGVSFAAPININGDFSLALTGDSPVLSGVGSSTTTALTVSGADALAEDGSADYYLAVKPFAVSAGQEISLTVSTDAGDQTLTAVMPSDYSFELGKIATLNFNYTNKAASLVTFDYTDSDWVSTTQGISLPASGAGTGLDGSYQTNAPIRVFAQKRTGTDPKVWNTSGSYDLRIYKKNHLIVSSYNNKVITKITFTGATEDLSVLTTDVGTFTAASKTWTGNAAQVDFAVDDAAGTTRISTINVFYQDANDADHMLSVPATTYSVAHNATSFSFPISVANATGLSASSTSDGVSSTTPSTGTGLVTVNFSANEDHTPRDFVVTVSSTNPEFSTSVTITQSDAPVTISELTNGTTATVTAQIAAIGTQGFIIADGTGAIYVYKTVAGISIGQTVTVSGTVGNYSKGLQFPGASTVTKGDTGSYSYGDPTSFGTSEITTWNGDANNRLASYVTLTGVVNKDGDYFNIIVGGGETPNATLYTPLAVLTAPVADGDNITVTGYALNVMGSTRCGVIPTAITNNETTPKLFFTDISNIAAAGVTDATHSVTSFRTDGWTPNVTYTGCVSAASINAACTTITYSVSENNDNEAKAGTILITFSKAGQPDVPFTINVAQVAKGATTYYYQLVTSTASIDAGTYVIGALRSTSATNNFYFATNSTTKDGSKYYWTVSASSITVNEVAGVRRFVTTNLPDGAVEFTLTGDNTNGFTISSGDDYLYYTSDANNTLAFAAAGSTQKWIVEAKDSPLITGGVVLSAVRAEGSYRISENSTAVGALRGYYNASSATAYRAMYLFKKVSE